MDSTLQLFVKEPSAGKTIVLQLDLQNTLKELLDKITDKTGWPCRYFFLTQNSRHINTYSEESLNKTLNDLQINKEMTIICHPKLCPN